MKRAARSVFAPRLRSACVLSLSAWSCATPNAAPANSRSAGAASQASAELSSQRPKEQARTPFSGEIVYRQTAFGNGSFSEARDLGNLHYFISGRHWKHVDEGGDTVALYDPDANVVHYFKPERKTVNAAQSDGPATFESLPDTTVVLGRTCKAYRETLDGMNLVVFYDPALFVDPKPYTQHKFRHWGESLAFSGGGLSLASRTELPKGTIVSEAISIEARTFEPSFWSVSNNAPKESATRP